MKADRELRVAAREEAVDREIAGRVDRGGRETCLVVRPQLRGRLVVALNGRSVRGRREARKIRVGRRTLGRLSSSARQLRKPCAVRAIRRGDTRPSVANDSQRDDDVVDQRRLVHLGAGEPGEARPLGEGDCLALLAARFERGARDVQRAAQDFTPIWTSRNRAGAAPWETCALWPGWPLPQFVSP